MLRSDNYRLEYEVTVDTAEEGFDYEVSYPANGKTTIRYNDDRDSDIPVPTVITCSAEVVLSGLKYLDEEVAEGFEFALSVNGEILQTVSSDADGKFVFDGLVFTEAGEHVYTIAEVIGDDEEIIYDETVYTITVIVVQENDKLHADVVVTVEEAAHEGEIRFDNTTLTKIPDEDPPLEELPATGDMGMAPMVTALVSMMSLAAVATIGKKKEII
jgi:pilin isopeptide linkage protein